MLPGFTTPGPASDSAALRRYRGRGSSFSDEGLASARWRPGRRARSLGEARWGTAYGSSPKLIDRWGGLGWLFIKSLDEIAMFKDQNVSSPMFPRACTGRVWQTSLGSAHLSSSYWRAKPRSACPIWVRAWLSSSANCCWIWSAYDRVTGR